jgi:hypothetical protein
MGCPLELYAIWRIYGREQLLREMVDHYARTGSEQKGEIKIKRVQDRKTTYVEQSGEGGRYVIMKECKADGKTYWAGYSSRSQTVYISLAA